MTVNHREIVLLEQSRYPRARSVIGRAFRDYNLMCYACPHDRRRLPGVTAVYGAIMHDCYRCGEVYVTSDGAGVASWLPPTCAVPGLVRQIRGGMLGMPWHFGLRGFRILVEYDNEARRLHHQHAPMPHWYLAAIGVEPEFQGQGVGSALMTPMLARADAEGVPCYLDTHVEKNVRLYERHGFEIAEYVELAGHPIPIWSMLRKPRGAAG